MHKIIHGYCIQELKKLPSEGVDLILTDPPYGNESSVPTSMCKSRALGSLVMTLGCATRIATRYDKLARNFLAAAALVGALYWIKLLVQTHARRSRSSAYRGNSSRRPRGFSSSARPG